MTGPIDRIYALWEELEQFPAADCDAALVRLLARLCELFDARNALWSVVVRLPAPVSGDALHGWRPRLVRVLNSAPAVTQSVKEQYDGLWSPTVDMSQILAVSGEEPFRTRLLFESLPAEWFEGDHYRRHYLAVGHADSMSMRCALNDDVRIHLFLFRGAKDNRFRGVEKEPFGLATRGLKWFYRQLALSHGLLLANAPLTPTERKVLLGLLDGRVEKQIASDLEQSPNTTHVHVSSIYNKFGVRHRSALTALWLGKIQ